MITTDELLVKNEIKNSPEPRIFSSKENSSDDFANTSVLNDLIKQVQELREFSKEANRNYEKTKIAHQNFFDRDYPAEFNQINEDKRKLEKCIQTIKDREEEIKSYEDQIKLHHLGKNRHQLLQYATILSEENLIHIPSEQIPENVLLEMLDCNSEDKEKIKEIYANSLSWSPTLILKNHWNSDLVKNDILFIKNLVAKKIEEIKSKIDVILPSVLDELTQEYLKTIAEIQQDLINIQKEAKNLTLNIMDRPGQLEKKKYEADKELADSSYQANIFSFSYKFAKLALGNYTFEHKLYEHEKKLPPFFELHNQIENILTSLSKGDINSLTHLEKEQLAHHQTSLADLINQRDSLKQSFDNLEKALNLLNQEIKGVNLSERVLTELAQQRENLATRLDYLKNKAIDINKQIDAAITKGNQLQNEIKNFEQLATIKEKYLALIARAKFAENDENHVEIRNQLLTDIDHLIADANYNEFLEKIDAENNSLYETKLSQLTEIIASVHHIQDFLTQEKEFWGYNEEVRQISPANDLKTKQTLADKFLKRSQSLDILPAYLSTDTFFKSRHERIKSEVIPALKQFTKDTQQQTQSESYKSYANEIYQDFFGGNPTINNFGANNKGANQGTGKFSNYLEKRAKTFWLRDLFESVAAFSLGCFGYKTNLQKRTDYIDELKSSLEACKNDATRLETELQPLIEKGLKEFSPRVKNDQAKEYQHTLKATLEAFQSSITTLKESVPVDNLEQTRVLA